MPNTKKETLKKQFHLETKSPLFRQALNFCERVADSHANVLLTGESGCGKEIASRYIHACGRRSGQNFVAVNCSAFTETLLESELFGHEQGSFTGASKTHTGKFELSNHGTLFLDEIGDLSLTTQIKLLRALETKQIERIGSNTKREIDFQLITATNQDLPEKIRSREFREDFFRIIREFISDGEHGVVLATHLIPDLERIADYVAMLDGGKLVFCMERTKLEDSYRIVSGEAYKLRLIPKERVIAMESYEYGARAFVKHSKHAVYDPELCVSVPTLKEIMYYHAKKEGGRHL